MKRHPVISISFLTIVVITTLWVLYSQAKLPNENNNGFVRRELNASKLISKSKVDPQLLYVSGVSDTSIFLSGSNPRAIMVLDSNFMPTDTLSLKIALKEEDLVPSKVFIDSGNLFIHFYNSKHLVQGNLSKKTLALKKLETGVFTKSIQTTPEFLIIRSFSRDSSKPIVQKIDCNTGNPISEYHFKNIKNDFGISSDGFFTFDNLTKTIIYVHYFLNKLIFLDTNLVERNIGRTIDTTYNNSVQIGWKEEEGSDKQIIPLTSRMKVNSHGTCYNGQLYIASEIRADNETLSEFRKNVVIDVYDVQTNMYRGSFYLPKYKSKSLKDFKIFSNKILTLYEGEIQCYKLPSF